MPFPFPCSSPTLTRPMALQWFKYGGLLKNPKFHTSSFRTLVKTSASLKKHSTSFVFGFWARTLPCSASKLTHSWGTLVSCCLPRPLKLRDFRNSHYIQFTRWANISYRSTSAFSDGRRQGSQISYKMIMGQNHGDKGPIYTDFDSWKNFLLYLYFQLATASKLKFFTCIFCYVAFGDPMFNKVFLKEHFRLFSKYLFYLLLFLYTEQNHTLSCLKLLFICNYMISHNSSR